MEKQKKRNAGIDLLRLIGMFFIILNHFLCFGGLFRKYSKFKKELTYLHIFTDWHYNGFTLISGIIGYKTNRYSNLLYLWLTVFFYSVGVHLYVKTFKKNFIITNDISKEFFPIVFKRYWYFTIYFGMYLFLPVINKGISCLTKYELRLVIISTLGIFVFWKDLNNPNIDVFTMNGGSSIIWFITYYLVGAYIGKYKIDYSGLKKYIFCFICLFIYFISSYLHIKLYVDELNFKNGNFTRALVSIARKMFSTRLDSFLRVAQSTTICLFFLQIYYNKYLDKIICFLGPLAFGIYLIHAHPILVINLLKHIFDNESKEMNLTSIISILLLKSLKMFVFSLIVDYLRNILFNLMKLRKICIFFEFTIKKLFLNYEEN
jgi:surface polysaccharide O-acyltransferase-like enzyme